MPGRVSGSKKCDQCGHIHLPGGRCKTPANGTSPEAPTAMQSTRAAGDFRSLQERMNLLEARMALLEAQIRYESTRNSPIEEKIQNERERIL